MNERPAPAEGGGAARTDGVPASDIVTPGDERQPETQEGTPLEAELGEDGQGDLAPEDGVTTPDDGPDDLRIEDPR